MGTEGGRTSWRVRLRARNGRVLGAGTMVDSRHVLTCAHVVQHPDAVVGVDFVALPDVSPGHASVLDGFWVPPSGGEGGDIALLRLEQPESRLTAAPLYRMPLVRGRTVSAYGFPAGGELGVWFAGQLTNEGGPGGEWVQMNKAAESEPVSPGYSGAAVIDDDTNYVVGMVVSRFETQANLVSWMIPVETMLGYLPDLGRWVGGSPGVDKSIAERPRSERVDPDFWRKLAGYFSGVGPGVPWVMVTGGADSALAISLRLMILLADRERAAGVGPTALPAGVLPPSGSLALAVDATGKTAEDVRLRIEERLRPIADSRLARPDRFSGMTLVIDAIDDAAEPEKLVTDVLLPLVARSPELGFRLVLAFRRETSPEVTLVRSGTGALPPGQDELGVLAAGLAELDEIEERHLHVSPRFTGIGDFPPQARRLRVALTQLQAARDDGDEAWVRRHLPACRHAVTRALRRGHEHRDVLEQRMARRAELRARLDAYGEMAADHGVVEDTELDSAYAPAWQLLFEGSCDLLAAASAVEHYARAVRKRIDGTKPA